MSRPAISRAAPPGPRMPESVLRRRPAEIVARPRPALTPVRMPPGRVPGRAPARPLPRPARRPMPLGLMAAILVFVGLFTVGTGLGAATGFDLGQLFKGPDKPPPRAFPVLDPSTPKRLTIRSIKVEAPI